MQFIECEAHGVTRECILAERMRRHGLTRPATGTAEYVALFRRLQPVAPVASTYPGSPPSLDQRTTFDNEKEAAASLRRDRRLVKARYQRGRVGYVHADDLALYARAFRRPLDEMNDVQDRVYEVLCEGEPMDTNQIQEEATRDDQPLLKKQIMPALHRLQEAFLVYEDQVETDWARCWCDFAQAWPEVDLEGEAWDVSAAEVVRRFISAHVFATAEEVEDWSRFSTRDVGRLLSALEAKGAIAETGIEGLGDGWMADTSIEDAFPPSRTWMLHKADPLVQAKTSALKRRYGSEEVLQYLLIDGDIQGAVLGHWRISPHDVDDVVVELPKKERGMRREEILAEVRKQYRGPDSSVICYDGKVI